MHQVWPTCIQSVHYVLVYQQKIVHIPTALYITISKILILLASGCHFSRGQIREGGIRYYASGVLHHGGGRKRNQRALIVITEAQKTAPQRRNRRMRDNRIRSRWGMNGLGELASIADELYDSIRDIRAQALIPRY